LSFVMLALIFPGIVGLKYRYGEASWWLEYVSCNQLFKGWFISFDPSFNFSCFCIFAIFKDEETLNIYIWRVTSKLSFNKNYTQFAWTMRVRVSFQKAYYWNLTTLSEDSFWALLKTVHLKT
jgi:hypothetical protein